MKPKLRRTFLKESGIVLAGIPAIQSITSYNRILGANDRVRVGVVGLHSRGSFLTDVALDHKGFEVAALCDVDSRTVDKQLTKVSAKQSTAPKTFKDFREMINQNDIDAVVIATADHTHAPFAVYALNAGKHVYLEKPSSFLPGEGEILVQMNHALPLQFQIGNQQRSSVITQEAIAMIHAGAIGIPYEARAWYTNQRGTIGNGEEAPVPGWLDWDLWQGPAPRRPFRNNIVHYNWHWFRHWGTGEICNNAEHEIDIGIWALQKQYPNSVTSDGGRFHYTGDDWEFFDTQLVTYEFDDNVRLVWDGRSCTNLQPFNRGRGTIIYGTTGSMLMDRNGYVQFDLAGKSIKERNEEKQTDGTDITGEDILTVRHFDNWHRGISQSEKLNSPAAEAHVSNLMCHVGNMAQDAGRTLQMNPETGHVKDPGIMKGWHRKYEPGWEI